MVLVKEILDPMLDIKKVTSSCKIILYSAAAIYCFSNLDSWYIMAYLFCHENESFFLLYMIGGLVVLLAFINEDGGKKRPIQADCILSEEHNTDCDGRHAECLYNQRQKETAENLLHASDEPILKEEKNISPGSFNQKECKL